MQWKIREIKTAEEFFTENYGDRDIPADAGDCMEMMKAYAEYVLEGVATQAKVRVSNESTNHELMNFMGLNRDDKGVNVHVSKDSILKLKDKL